MTKGTNGRADIENGFTRIANQILDRIIAADLTKRELRVLLATIRETYGYQVTETEISLTRYAILTGLRPGHISTAISSLEEKKMLLPKREGQTAQIRAINRNLWEWRDSQIRNTQNGNTQNGNDGITETGKNPLPKREHSIKKIKDKVKENTSRPAAGKVSAKVAGKKFNLAEPVAERFLRFWNAFDYKTGRAEAAGEWSKLDKANDPIPAELFDRIIAAAEISAKERPKVIEAGRTPKMAQGWLAAERYLDEYFDKAIEQHRRAAAVKAKRENETPEQIKRRERIAYIDGMRAYVKDIPDRDPDEDLDTWIKRAEQFIAENVGEKPRGFKR